MGFFLAYLHWTVFPLKQVVMPSTQQLLFSFIPIWAPVQSDARVPPTGGLPAGGAAVVPVKGRFPWRRSSPCCSDPPAKSCSPGGLRRLIVLILYVVPVAYTVGPVSRAQTDKHSRWRRRDAARERGARSPERDAGAHQRRERGLN